MPSNIGQTSAGGSGSGTVSVDVTDRPARQVGVVDTELPAAIASADGVANPTITRLQTYPLIFNGTSWDRLRTQSSTPDGTSLGATVGVLATMPLMSDTASVQRFMTMPAADNQPRQEYLAVGLGVFDGATYDRATGDSTNGLDVDVTRVSGSVAVTGTFWQATQPVSGTFFQATQPVSIAATVTVDTELPAAVALSDAFANPTAPAVGTFNFGWNGTTWDRLKSTTANGLVVDVSRVQGSVAVTGTFWQATQPVSIAGTVTVDTELTAAAALADATANPTITNIAALNLGFNGTTWDRLRVANANLVGTEIGLVVRQPSELQHDAVNVLDTMGMGATASGPDAPPTLISANGDRVRLWADKAGALITRQRKVRETFVAVYRKAEAAGRLELVVATAANTTKQLATLHHAATATKELQILRVRLWINSVDVATQGFFELRKINTAPATGNPAITPLAYKDNAAATEAVCLAIPTTAGTEVSVNSPAGSTAFWDLPITTAQAAPAPIQWKQAVDLYNFDETSDAAQPLTLRTGQLQGIAIVARTVLAVTNLFFWAEIIYSEETV